MFDLFFTSKIEKQKMEEEQRGRELVYEEMVRKYLIIIYLCFLSLSQEMRLFQIKTIFSILLQHFWLLYITKFYIIIRNSKHRLQLAAKASKALNLETFSDKFILNFKAIFNF